MERKILHIDMDAFYASIEQRDNPDLIGKPLAVGYGEKRGVVAAASYEARKYGVYSAMPSTVALRKCPHLIFVMPRFEVYRSVSEQIHDIFYEYTDQVEPLSLDEAFLDVTINKMNMRSATLIAKEIKCKIKEQTNLTASAGVSYNKFLAKIASDYKKPDGLYVITPKRGESFIEKLNINRFFGVGPVTANKMNELGIHNGADLKQWSEFDLAHHFGKAGLSYYQYARGLDDREVVAERVRKSLGAEETFLEDISDLTTIEQELYKIAQEVARRLSERDFNARTLTLKVKYADFTIITRSITLDHYITSAKEMLNIAMDLLSRVEDIAIRKVRLLGLTLKNPDVEDNDCSALPIQLEIDFDNPINPYEDKTEEQ
ncbi:MAG: DNA polymerase IV [Dysgonamonadaceae bacterium]|nr:DNA polymerase IV [Dysgonamonadaceae bacterium]